MKTIGIIGGMSWTSTAEYYRLLNEQVTAQRGGLESPPILLHSLNFAEVVEMQRSGRWDEAGELLARAGQGLERAGADCLLVATNTMHKVAPAIEAATGIPLLHIADSTAEAIRAAGLTRVGLLATRFTMEQDFYRERLARHGIEVLVPDAEERAEVHRVIFEELCCNVVRPEARSFYQTVMQGLVARGAQGMVLGCTEIMLLVGAGDTTVPVFDTTALHVDAAVRFVLDQAARPQPVPAG
ncbi:aspartate/glutamate racemase family protein [Deinococcus sonorensis]|uniref:Aspartate/glutamate racemase family protein n=2 Tax=Deinococcus sonorensis TaxID=309891 RepID=A0AAU7U7Y2_9DEIO